MILWWRMVSPVMDYGLWETGSVTKLNHVQISFIFFILVKYLSNLSQVVVVVTIGGENKDNQSSSGMC